jgi:hypothetical protein
MKHRLVIHEFKGFNPHVEADCDEPVARDVVLRTGAGGLSATPG